MVRPVSALLAAAASLAVASPALAALPVGANVYLMARQFQAMEAPVAASLVASSIVAALTVPMILALLGAPTS